MLPNERASDSVPRTSCQKVVKETETPHLIRRLRQPATRASVRPREREDGGGYARRRRAMSLQEAQVVEDKGSRFFDFLTLIRRLRLFGQRGNVRSREIDCGGGKQDSSTRRDPDKKRESGLPNNRSGKEGSRYVKDYVQKGLLEHRVRK